MIRREETLETLLKQEKTFQLTDFTHADALFVLNHIVDKVKETAPKPVTVHIEYDGLVVAHYLMDGRGDSDWVARKIKTVMESQHSSLYVFRKNEDKGDYENWVEDPSYAVCGGGFPILINNQVRGCIVVSGLEHHEDHRVIVNALEHLLKQSEKR